MSLNDSSGLRWIRQSDSGQIVVEYILLLVTAVAVAVFITNLMVGRGDDEGFLITKWKAIVSVIAADQADDFKRETQ